ncbi:hypothetical protein EXS71_03485 [Candidatus Uhrbacteria bacterium]|nr:hypothetical protein [Candidatus Uhrbacteria bacterium]
MINLVKRFIVEPGHPIRGQSLRTFLKDTLPPSWRMKGELSAHHLVGKDHQLRPIVIRWKRSLERKIEFYEFDLRKKPPLTTCSSIEDLTHEFDKSRCKPLEVLFCDDGELDTQEGLVPLIELATRYISLGYTGGAIPPYPGALRFQNRIIQVPPRMTGYPSEGCFSLTLEEAVNDWLIQINHLYGEEESGTIAHMIDQCLRWGLKEIEVK